MTEGGINYQSFILFVDHEGHVAPLGLCYHATASRHLSSSIERHPPSTVTEVDSAYCPHCLVFNDVASASQLGFCPKPSCQRCPHCQSVSTIIVDDSNQCFYACGYCTWKSLETIAIACPDESQIKESAEKLGRKLNIIRRENEDRAEMIYENTLKVLEARAVDGIRIARQPNYIYHKDTMSRSCDWSMEALIKSIGDRKKKVGNDGITMVGISEEIKKPSKAITTAIQATIPTVNSFLLSPLLSSHPYQLPIPIPLRPRKSRRCRAELKEGRPGILVKPKLNPLEGDTSLRSGHGQWYKKDSSALLVVPSISVEALKDDAVLLRVHNPTLGNVELSFGPSYYCGEPTWDNSTTVHWTDVLVDSLQNKILSKITLDTSFKLPVSDSLTLQAVEDVFLEMGGKGNRLPSKVLDWNGSTELGWIAKEGDKAWFSFMANSSECIPFSMNIKVSKGSWESSLVKPSVVDNDMVTFDLVLIRTPSLESEK